MTNLALSTGVQEHQLQQLLRAFDLADTGKGFEVIGDLLAIFRQCLKNEKIVSRFSSEESRSESEGLTNCVLGDNLRKLLTLGFDSHNQGITVGLFWACRWNQPCSIFLKTPCLFVCSGSFGNTSVQCSD